MASMASTVLAPGGSWWLLVAPGGSWWLLVASVASAASMDSMAPGSYGSSIIDQSISEACSPGACCALDTP